MNLYVVWCIRDQAPYWGVFQNDPEALWTNSFCEAVDTVAHLNQKWPDVGFEVREIDFKKVKI